MLRVSEHAVNIALLTRDQPERSQSSKQTNKIGEVDIQSLLNLNSDFNILFNDNELKHIFLVFTPNLQIFKSADFTPVQNDIAAILH